MDMSTYMHGFGMGIGFCAIVILFGLSLVVLLSYVHGYLLARKMSKVDSEISK